MCNRPFGVFIMTTYLYLIRHGETTLNKSKVYYGSLNCGLSDIGIKQGKELSKLLKDKVDVVISSPLERAIRTASLVSNLKQGDIVIDEGLREIDFGLWEGLNYKEISTKYENDWNNWVDNWINVAPPEGESFIMQYCRVKESLENILTKYKDKKIMIVTHQGTLRIITTILLKMTYDGFWNFTFEQGTYSLFEITDEHLTIRKINCKR